MDEGKGYRTSAFAVFRLLRCFSLARSLFVEPSYWNICCNMELFRVEKGEKKEIEEPAKDGA